MTQILVAGVAEGEVLVLTEPLSFWGGVHEASGDVIDIHHPQHGANVSGRVLVMPAGRGSSSSSSVLAEIIRAGVGPAAILLGERDPIIALGALVAEALYRRTVPVVVLEPDEYARVTAWRRVRVQATGELEASDG
jgi:predicted aconitase with swiveling domain